MLKLRPPQHTIDDESVFISKRDPAWDFERLEEEKTRLGEAAIANMPLAEQTQQGKAKAWEAAVVKHPVERWYACESRYSLKAKMTVPERLRSGKHLNTAATILDYWTDRQIPTQFVIKSLGARTRIKVSGMIATDQGDWIFKVVEDGLVEIRQGAETIDVSDTEATFDMLDAADNRLIQDLAVAIWRITHAEVDAAKKP